MSLLNVHMHLKLAVSKVNEIYSEVVVPNRQTDMLRLDKN